MTIVRKSEKLSDKQHGVFAQIRFKTRCQ